MRKLILTMMMLVLAARGEAEVSRVISLSPTATEMMFDIGAGGLLVAVTDFCDRPPEARKIRSIGGMMDVSLETVAAISPDLVLLSAMNAHLADDIEGMGYRCFTAREGSVREICESMIELGALVGRREEASARVDALRHSLVSGSASDVGERRRALVVVGRDESGGELRGVYAAGRGSFYDELLTLAGADNAFDGSEAYAMISREGMLSIDPDVVIELAGDVDKEEAHRMARSWGSFDGLRAVREDRVRVVTGTAALRAGPSCGEVVAAFAALLASMR